VTEPGADVAALDGLAALHAAVDREAAALAARLGPCITCHRGCADCCQDGLTVLTLEVERIRRTMPDLLAAGRPHAPGACAMLDADGSCRIYPVRPYVCRTQGLPLQVFTEDAAGDLEERRDICPLNRPEEPLDRLPDDRLWTVGPWELKLVRLQERFAGAVRRVALRSLFRTDDP